MSKTEIELGKLQNSCFVIMPFSAVFNLEYTGVIRPAIEKAGLKAIRGDEIYSKPHIVEAVWKSLRSSRIVIAELSGKNTNVFYELGLAHALGKPVIIMTRNEQDVPFDLKALRYLYYDITNPSWGENLRNELISMIERLLKEEEYGAVFEGIKTVEAEKFRKVKPAKKKALPQIHDLTGNWKGQMKSRSIVYDLNLELFQQENELAGILVSAFKMGGTDVVVQQTIKGSILKNFVTFNGVSYTFLQQGNLAAYNLDSFSGRLSDKGNKISGKSVDEGKTVCSFILERVH